MPIALFDCLPLVIAASDGIHTSLLRTVAQRLIRRKRRRAPILCAAAILGVVIAGGLSGPALRTVELPARFRPSLGMLEQPQAPAYLLFALGLAIASATTAWVLARRR